MAESNSVYRHLSKAVVRRTWLAAGVVIFLALVAVTATTFIFRDSAGPRLVKTVRIEATVTVAAISRDGRFVASADMSNPTVGASQISLRKASDGTLLSSTGPVNVYSLIFSPDSTTIAAAGNDGVRLFRISDGYLLRTFPGDQVFCSTFSPDGRLLAIAGANGRIQILQVHEFAILKVLTVPKWVTSLAFSHDGKMLAAGTSVNTGLVRRDELSTAENPIFIFRFFDSESPSQLKGHTYGVLTVAFSQSGNLLASGGSDGIVRLSEISTGRSFDVSHSLPGTSVKPNGAPAVRHISFDPYGNLFSAALQNGSILFFDSSGKLKKSIEAHRDSVLWTVFIFATSEFISIGRDSNVHFWKLERL